MYNVYAMFGSPEQLLIILLVVLVLFGGKKIPELMRGVGRGVGELQRGLNEGKQNLTEALKEEPHTDGFKKEEVVETAKVPADVVR